MYVSSRGISQSSMTKTYINWTKQDGRNLPYVSSCKNKKFKESMQTKLIDNFYLRVQFYWTLRLWYPRCCEKFGREILKNLKLIVSLASLIYSQMAVVHFTLVLEINQTTKKPTERYSLKNKKYPLFKFLTNF